VEGPETWNFRWEKDLWRYKNGTVNMVYMMYIYIHTTVYIYILYMYIYMYIYTYTLYNIYIYTIWTYVDHVMSGFSGDVDVEF
jgi:hypothetical protein